MTNTMFLSNQQFVMSHDSMHLPLIAEPPPMVRPQGTVGELSFAAKKVTALLFGARFSTNRNGW